MGNIFEFCLELNKAHQRRRGCHKPYHPPIRFLSYEKKVLQLSYHQQQAQGPVGVETKTKKKANLGQST
jgi:hypothetical protein